MFYLYCISKNVGNNTADIAVLMSPPGAQVKVFASTQEQKKAAQQQILGASNALATAEQQAVAAPRLLSRAGLSRQLAGLGWQSRGADVCFLVGQALSESKLCRECVTQSRLRYEDIRR